jgi:hypothetical protein
MGGCPTRSLGQRRSSVRSVPGASRLARAGSTPPEFGRLAEQRRRAVTPGCPAGLRLEKGDLELKARASAKQRRGNTSPRRFER